MSLALTGCWNTEHGQKHGTLVKVSKVGKFWGTYEGEIIRGGLSDANGANGQSFHFSFGMFKSKLVTQAQAALTQNKPILLSYHCEAFVFPLRGESKCFVDEIKIL